MFGRGWNTSGRAGQVEDVDTLNPEQRYRAIFTDAYADVLRFVRRRCDADRAEDVTAQAFLVAWRRVAELPTRADDARACGDSRG